MRKLLYAVLFTLLMVGCATGPVSNPLDDYWDGLSGEYYAKTAFSIPKAWAPGQYMLTGSTDKGKRLSVTKMRLVRQEGDGWVIEILKYGFDGKPEL